MDQPNVKVGSQLSTLSRLQALTPGGPMFQTEEDCLLFVEHRVEQYRSRIRDILKRLARAEGLLAGNESAQRDGRILWNYRDYAECHAAEDKVYGREIARLRLRPDA